LLSANLLHNFCPFAFCPYVKMFSVISVWKLWHRPFIFSTQVRLQEIQVK